MALDPNTLPDDPVLLRGVISQLLGAVEKLERKNAWLQAEVEALFRKLFRQRTAEAGRIGGTRVGVRSDAIWESLRVSLSEPLNPEVPGQGTSGAAPLHGRQPLPKALPRERIEHALPEQERCCTACGVELTKIREEVTEQLDYTPGLFQDHRARARGVRLQEL